MKNDSEDKMTFGEWIRERRAAAGISQAKLAEAAGISLIYAGSLERGKPTRINGRTTRPSLAKVERIAEALGASYEEALACLAREHGENQEKPEKEMEGARLFRNIKVLRSLDLSIFDEAEIEEIAAIIRLKRDLKTGHTSGTKFRLVDSETNTEYTITVSPVKKLKTK